MSNSVYLYGLQRSGTSWLTECLEKNYSFQFTNTNEKNRDSPRVKHFRIYDNKDLIPEEAYFNDFLVQDITDLDKLLGDSTHTNKYIVIYKDIFAWLPSIQKWALNCKWKQQNKTDFVEDFLHFIDKWKTIQNERVMMIPYLELIETNNTIMQQVEEFLGFEHNDHVVLPEKISSNPTFNQDRKQYYLQNDFMNLYSEQEIQQIKNHPLYLKHFGI